MCEIVLVFCVDLVYCVILFFFFFFFNDTATTEIYTLSLHDALPISPHARHPSPPDPPPRWRAGRSEEHTSELQSLTNLVCRLLLEKKKKKNNTISIQNKKNENTINKPLHEQDE